MSDSSDDGVVYQCNKCPKRTQFQTKQDFAQHRKKFHPKEKSRKQLQEEEDAEEASLLASMITSPRPSSRQSPRTVEAPSGQQTDGDGNEPEDSSGETAEKDAEQSRTGKRGRPAGAKSPSKKGKPEKQTAKGGPKSRKVPVKGKPGGKSKAVAPWMDDEFTQSRFSGG